jgi:hypothetical protein
MDTRLLRGTAIAVTVDEAEAPRLVSGLHRISTRAAERRSNRRVPLVTRAIVHVRGALLDGVVEDVSETGVFVRLVRLLSAGTRVRVRFLLPEGRFEAGATVVRFRLNDPRGPGVGLHFHDVAAEDAARLAAYCAAR